MGVPEPTRNIILYLHPNLLMENWLMDSTDHPAWLYLCFEVMLKMQNYPARSKRESHFGQHALSKPHKKFHMLCCIWHISGMKCWHEMLSPFPEDHLLFEKLYSINVFLGYESPICFIQVHDITYIHGIRHKLLTEILYDRVGSLYSWQRPQQLWVIAFAR
jgi:hypothetical protein